jgi:hypothetical protein
MYCKQPFFLSKSLQKYSLKHLIFYVVAYFNCVAVCCVVTKEAYKTYRTWLPCTTH